MSFNDDVEISTIPNRTHALKETLQTIKNQQQVLENSSNKEKKEHMNTLQQMYNKTSHKLEKAKHSEELKLPSRGSHTIKPILAKVHYKELHAPKGFN